MKRFNLIFIATAFFLTTACTETEEVLPFNPSDRTVNIDDFGAPDASDEYTFERAPDLEVSLGSKNPGVWVNAPHRIGEHNAGNGEEAVVVHFGELLPASQYSCGTFIRKSNGTLFNVLNADIPENFLETGSKVRFSYKVPSNLGEVCDFGTHIELTGISFTQEEVNSEALSNTENIETH